MSKHAALQALAAKRKSTRWNGYNRLSDYHKGVYECDHVSPYTKTAGNVDSSVFIMLQDWCSDSYLSMTVKPELITHGHDPSLPTNTKLKTLLCSHFGMPLGAIYGTNLFPFIKPENMSSNIPMRDLVRAAQQFGLPQIEIVAPRIVVCLGLPTYKALRSACNKPAVTNLDSAIDSPFLYAGAWVWCQAHTGALGQNNRNKHGVDRVTSDWNRMKAKYDAMSP